MQYPLTRKKQTPVQRDFNASIFSLTENMLQSPSMSSGSSTATGYTSTTESGITASFSIDQSSQKINITASTSANSAYVYQDIINEITAGDVVSIKVQGKVTGNVQARIMIDWYNGASLLSSVTSASFTNTNFETLVFDGQIAPANTNIARIRFICKAIATGNTGSAWFNNGYVIEALTVHGVKSFGEGPLSVTVQGNTAFQFVQNGNFVNTTGWTGIGATLSAANNILSVTGNGTSSNTRITQNTQITAVTGKKVFYKAWARVTNSDASAISIRINGSTGGTDIVVDTKAPTLNAWMLLSGIATLTDQTGVIQIIVRAQYIDATTANTKIMEVKEVMSVDLTAHGLDSLTIDQCNARFPNWLSYGTKSTLPVRLEMLKNLFDGVVEIGAISNTTGINSENANCIRSKNYVSVIPNSSVTISDDKNYRYDVYFYDISKNFISTQAGQQPYSFTTPSNAYYLRFRTSTTLVQNDLNTKIMVNSGASALPWEAFNPQYGYATWGTKGKGDSVGGSKDEVNLITGAGKQANSSANVVAAVGTENYTNNKHWILSNSNFITLTGSATAAVCAGKIEVYSASGRLSVVSSGYDDSSNQGKIYVNSDGTLRFITALAATDINAYLPMLINYQLLVPTEYGTDAYYLEGKENGTVIIEPVVKVYSAVDGSNQITLPGTAALDKIDFVRVNTGSDVSPIWTDVTSSASLNTSTRKITITNPTANKYQCDVYYKSEESTVPTVKISKRGRNSIIGISSPLI
jgi:hypothetical protein